MKYSIINAFLLATLASATPLPAGVEGQKAKDASDISPISIGATAGIQLSLSGEWAAPAFFVPIDGSITPTKGGFGPPVADSAFIFKVTEINPSMVTCQAFLDAKGKKPLGKPFNNGETATFGDSAVRFGAFSCKQI